MEKEEKENLHLNNLISKINSDFSDKVKNETNLSYTLLKGHLLIENILEETLATLDKIRKINRLSFYEKIKALSECSNSPISGENIKNITPALFALNETRNNLAHNLDFKISEDDINKIGVNLGKRFMVYKYEHGHKSLKENLLFCLNHIVHSLGVIIYLEIEEAKKKGGISNFKF